MGLLDSATTYGVGDESQILLISGAELTTGDPDFNPHLQIWLASREAGLLQLATSAGYEVDELGCWVAVNPITAKIDLEDEYQYPIHDLDMGDCLEELMQTFDEPQLQDDTKCEKSKRGLLDPRRSGPARS